MKNVDDLNRVEKISKEIEHKSEQLAQGGESTPYITKGKRSAELFSFLGFVFSLNRSSQGDEISHDLHGLEEHRKNRCVSEQETQTSSR